MQLTIAANRPGAEERWLHEAARQRGLAAQLSTADECASRLPAAGTVVLNRLLGLTQALALARLLEAAGVRSVNSAAVVATCGDKAATTARLEAARVPTPPTRIAFSPAAALAAIEELGYPVVVKPVVGSWGRLLAKVNDRDAAEAVVAHQEASTAASRSVYYLQRFVPLPARDLRAVVAGDRVLCAVERRSEHWIRNLTRHHQPAPVAATGEIEACALAAAAAVGGGVLGVDLLQEPDGRLLVLEVNHRPEFRWTQQAAGIDIAGAVLDWVRESSR